MSKPADTDTFLERLGRLQPVAVQNDESLDPQELFYRAGFEAGCKSAEKNLTVAQRRSRLRRFVSIVSVGSLAAAITFPIAFLFGQHRSIQSTESIAIVSDTGTNGHAAETDEKNFGSSNVPAGRPPSLRAYLAMRQLQSPTLTAIGSDSFETLLAHQSVRTNEIRPEALIQNRSSAATLTAGDSKDFTTPSMEKAN